MGVSSSLPVTGYIKMVDTWMIFTMFYPFMVIVLQCSLEVKLSLIYELIYVYDIESVSSSSLYNFLSVTDYRQKTQTNNSYRVMDGTLAHTGLRMENYD